MRSIGRGLLAVSFAGLCTVAAKKEGAWLEVCSPHFTVVSNAGERWAKQVAREFEQIRSVYQKALPRVRVDPAQPIIIMAVKDEEGLKELLPEFWETKDRFRPAGLFRRGPDRHYVALKTNARGENPYHIVYHEYFHLLAELNIPGVPCWVNEGLAEYWGQTSIRGKRVETGRPSESHIQLLRGEKLLPLDVLFTVDHSSPYYNQKNKVSIFYAQSWALTHFLMVGDEAGSGREKLGEYLNLVQSDVESLEAARRAFGDLGGLEQEVRSYIHRFSFRGFRMDAPPPIGDGELVVRRLSLAESAARRGDFLVHGGQLERARVLLDRALAEDPDLALSHEAMGFLYFREGDSDQAAKWFEEAVKLDSQSYLAHYFFALSKLRSGGQEAGLEVAERSLRRAMELNTSFAPAYAELAAVYARRSKDLDQALGIARRAISLEPGTSWYYVNAGQILLMLERPDEARQLAEKAVALAQSTEEETYAQSFLNEVARFEEYLAACREAADQSERAIGNVTPEEEVQTVRGRFSSLTCRPDGTYDAVVISGDRTYILHADSPKEIIILEGGESVFKELPCGPQDFEVVAQFTTAQGEAGGPPIRGKLLSLEFLGGQEKDG